MTALHDLVRSARSAPTRVCRADDMAAVDGLLDALARATERGEPLGLVVAGARLGRVRLREGCDADQVDAFLAERGAPRPAQP